MTVYIHASIKSVSFPDVTITPTKAEQKEIEAGTTRTWSVTANPDIEGRILSAIQLSSKVESKVPLTPDEEMLADNSKQVTARETGHLLQALSEMAAERVLS